MPLVAALVLSLISLTSLFTSTTPAGAQQSAPAPAAAGGTNIPIEQVPAVWPRMTPKQQFLTAEQLIKIGQSAMAEQLLQRTEYAYPGDRNVKRFYLAMAAKGQGRHQEAVDSFRAILAQNPEFSRVRLELAHTLYAINEDDSARHHFELLLGSTASQPGLDGAVRGYINAIDGRKRWDFTAFMTIAPSTNLNQGTTNKTVMLNGLPLTLTDKNVQKSGVGVYGGFQAGYRHALTDTLDLVIAGGAQAKRYREGDFNDTLVNLSIGPRWRFGWGFLGIYGVADHRWSQDKDYSTSAGGLISAGVQLSPQDMLFADTGCSKRFYDKGWNGDDLSYQDGHICFVSARLDHHFDSRTYARILGTLSHEDTEMDHLDSLTKSGGVGLYREIPFGISLYLQALFSDVAFKGNHPAAVYARHDQRWDFSVNVTKRDLDIFGFAPMVQYTYTTNNSNIPFHDYDAHGVNLTLTKRF